MEDPWQIHGRAAASSRVETKALIARLIMLHLCASVSLASLASPHRARSLVKGWLRADPRPLNVPIGRKLRTVESFHDRDGQPLFHVVYLTPSGFVIVPADDSMEPILAFADDGIFDPSPDNPLGALVAKDIKGRFAKRRRLRSQAATSQNRTSSLKAKWDSLSNAAEAGESTPTTARLPSLSDLRVAPLVQSRWDQGDVSGYGCSYTCYNYYTTPPYAPDDYPCGCVATAMAQVMRYYSYPTAGIGLWWYKVAFSGICQWVQTRGGDGLGGPYLWGSMPLQPDCSITAEQQQAIGALCYDAAISVNTDFAVGGSGAYMAYLYWIPDRMQDLFHYENAVGAWKPSGITGNVLNEMVNPNLDARLPTLLGIFDDGGGHAVICDGYGYNGSTLYHHLNMGWSGVDDAWYALPSVGTSYHDFTAIQDCIYNIYTSGRGEIISGRVMDADSGPMAGVTVTAYNRTTGTHETTTDSAGIYALPRLPSNTTYSVVASQLPHVFMARNVQTGKSVDSGIIPGNRWGIDFVSQGLSTLPPVAHDSIVQCLSGRNTIVALNAEDDGYPDPPRVLSYVIKTLPTSGTLSDPQGGLITAVPYVLVNNGNQVIYTPDTGYIGTDCFTFQANDGGMAPNGGDSNVATVSSTVTILTSGLLAHYPFNGDAIDATGNGHDGVVYGASLTADRFGNPDSAYSFDGIDDYIGISNTADFGFHNESFSISLWAQVRDNERGYESFVHLGDHGSSRFPIAKGHAWWSGSRIYTEFDSGFGCQVISNKYNGELPLDTWMHLASVVDCETGTLRLYADGALQGEDDLPSFNFLSSPMLLFGMGPYGSNCLSGQIDDIKIWNRVLTDLEVQKMFEETPSNLVAHWKMDDNAQDMVVADSSGNGNDGVARRNTCTTSRAGTVGACLDFDGSNDYIAVPDSSDWSFDGDFTVTLWARFDSFNTRWWESAFVGQDEGGGLRKKWIFSYDPTSQKTLFHINGPGIGGVTITGNPWTAQTGAWYFVGVSRSGDTYTFYRQGVADGSQVNSTVLPDVSSPLTIGWAEGPAKFNGAIDDVRVYCRALPALDVEAVCDVGPSAHWKMDDDAADTTVVDSIGRGNDGTAQRNTEVLTISGMADDALSFDGTTDYIRVPERLEWVLAVDFTISLWVKYDSFNPKWWESAFLAQDQGGGKRNKWIFSYDPTTEQTLFHINGPGSSGPVITGDPWTAEAGQWYFIAISRSSDGAYSFYRQGADDGSEVNSEAIPDVSASWTIGWAEGAGRFDGTIDDVRVHNRVLSQAEILDLYEEVIGPSGIAKPLLGHWMMDDDASNPSVHDSSGIGNHGTARRDTSDLSTAGVISTALSFNGTTDYVSVPDQATWSFPGDFTIALWVKYDSFSPKWWEFAFVAQDEGGGPRNKWIFSYCPTSGKTLFHINGPGTGGPVLTGNQWSAQTDTWYFVGVVRNGNTYTFYRQGVADGSDTPPLTSPHSGTVGNETVFSSVTTDPSRRAMPFAMPEVGTLESITMYHEGGTGDVLLGVYTGAGLPDARIAVTVSTPVSSVAGWQTIDLTSPVEVAAGETIWLAWVFESNPGVRYQTGTPGRASSPAGWSGGMPATFGDSSTAGYVYSIYATYTAGGGTDTVTIPDVAAPLTIGWAEGDGKFDGVIDDVRIYNGALSPAKMQVLYNTGAGF